MTVGELRVMLDRLGIDGQKVPDDAPIVVDAGGETTQRIDTLRVAWTCDDVTRTPHEDGTTRLSYNVPRRPSALIVVPA